LRLDFIGRSAQNLCETARLRREICLSARRLCFISGLLQQQQQQQWSVAVMKYLPKEILHEAHSLITLG
jgi:hypothetical protein